MRAQANRGATFYIVNWDIKIPNINAITFVNNKWCRLNRSFEFLRWQPRPAKSFKCSRTLGKWFEIGMIN